MPRYFYNNARDTTDSTKSFSIFWLKANKYLEKDCFKFGGITWSRNGEPTGNISFRIDTSGGAYMQLDYKAKKHWETGWREKDYKVLLVKTPCFFGGFRWWFQCVNCARRAGVLYSADDYFVCRHCANLSYPSCNEGKRHREWPFSVLVKAGKADELYSKLKRQSYKGKPTRKFKRYLKMARFNRVDMLKAEIGLLKNLTD